MNIMQADRDCIANTYKRQELCIVKGKSATAYDEKGNSYIDFGSGIGVNSLGYCDEEWSKAVSLQASTLQHTSNLYYTAPAARLAKRLTELTAYKKVFLCNSGAEANECAIKTARKYSFDKYKTKDRCRILTLQNSFHGRTVTTLAATGQEVFHNYFFPFTEGFCYCPANDLKAAIATLKQGGFCAVMLEFIQGEGGVVPLTREFVRGLFDYCKESDILIIADEVQTGISRTGNLLASGGYGVFPDITTLAKGLGGGLPIGACLTDEKTSRVLGFSDHGTTFGGNPIVCAGALCVLNRVAPAEFCREVINKGNQIRQALSELEEVAEITGMGLMLGISLKSKTAGTVLNDCLQEGLIVLTAKDKIRLLPPLTITEEELCRGISILKKCLS